MAAYDTNALVTSIKRRASIPTTQATLGPADILDVANEELQGYVVPLLLKAHAGYLWTDVDQTIAGQTTFRMPTRAIGSKLAGVQFIDTLGNFRTVPQVSVDQLSDVDFGCYLKGNQLIVWNNLQPIPTPWVVLRMSYYTRPNTLIYPTAVGVVQSIASNVVTLTGTPPTGFTSSALYDLVRASPGFESLATDQTATVAGNALTFAGPITDLAAGDYVCLAKQAPVAQVPAEFHPLLAQAAAVKALQTICDFEALPEAEKILARMESDVVSLVAQRIDDSPQQVVARNGLLRNLW